MSTDPLDYLTEVVRKEADEAECLRDKAEAHAKLGILALASRAGDLARNLEGLAPETVETLVTKGYAAGALQCVRILSVRYAHRQDCPPEWGECPFCHVRGWHEAPAPGRKTCLSCARHFQTYRRGSTP